MKKLHIHLGSWKAASTLIQTTLRRNGTLLAESRTFFVDQYGAFHREKFARSFRDAIQAIQQNGASHRGTDKKCEKAAQLFEQMSHVDDVDRVIHSWENFVGHPFPPMGDTLYHGAVTAYWFDRYLGHLHPSFTFIVRNQADLIEAMYAQEVRKGRFLDTMDVFLDRFIANRDLSWLPVVEPFIVRFGLDSVRVIPFEIIKEGSGKFLDSFFEPIIDCRLEKTISHSNPSFSAKAVEIALQTYPGMTQDEIRKEEVRLVREYSNLKYPRSDFLGAERRAAILRGVAEDNEILFSRYISSSYADLAVSYQPDVKAKGQLANTQTWPDAVRAKSSNRRTHKLWLVNINGSRKVIPLVDAAESLVGLLPKNIAGRHVLLSAWDINIPLPKGEPIRARFVATRAGAKVKGIRLHLFEVIDGRMGRCFEMPTDAQRNYGLVIRTDASAKYTVVISHDRTVNPKDASIVLDMSEPQKVPSHIEFCQDGIRPGGAFGHFTSHGRRLKVMPSRVNALAAVSPNEAQTEPNWSHPAAPRPFFLTIDTESLYFKRPVMMTGEGMQGAQATYEILDALDRRHLKAVFYVNVYEHLQYGDDSIERLCKEIHDRGHEVALHCHKSDSLEFYRKEIVNYDFVGQRRILEYGKELIHKWLGVEVINFRAGGYQHNADTLRALEELGFRIDSSYFYKHSSHPGCESKFVQPYRIGRLIEVPVLYLPLVRQNGLISDHKFDINSLNLAELLATLDRGGAFLSVFNFMMHSFSFISRTRLEKNDPDDKLLMRGPPLNSKGMYMGVTSLRASLFQDFLGFLDALVEDERIRVCTMADSVDDLERIVDQRLQSEIVPVLYR